MRTLERCEGHDCDRAPRLIGTSGGVVHSASRIAGAMWLCAVLCALGCTPGIRAKLLEQAQRPSGSIPELKILHVAAEFGEGAGYAITPKMVIASGHQFANRTRAAAVEGAPMLVGNFADRVGLDRNQLTPRDDWVVLLGMRDRFEPNLIDPMARPEPGQRVLLGGFFLAGRNFRRKEVRQLRPSIIEGTAVDAASVSDEQAGLVLVEVLEGRYDGFSGGPAACVDQRGQVRVWGTIVYQGYLHQEGALRYVLGVAPLPEDLRERMVWKSY